MQLRPILAARLISSLPPALAGFCRGLGPIVEQSEIRHSPPATLDVATNVAERSDVRHDKEKLLLTHVKPAATIRVLNSSEAAKVNKMFETELGLSPDELFT